MARRELCPLLGATRVSVRVLKIKSGIQTSNVPQILRAAQPSVCSVAGPAYDPEETGLHRLFRYEPNLRTARAWALAASTLRFLGEAVVTSEPSRVEEACATSSTA